jgi:hypothetical protein
LIAKDSLSGERFFEYFQARIKNALAFALGHVLGFGFSGLDRACETTRKENGTIE